MSLFSRRFLGLMAILCAVLVFGFGGWTLMNENGISKKAYSAGRTLRVGLENYYPPFAMQDANGKHTGFDYDIAVALCNTLKADCEFVIKPFDETLAMLSNGELDMMVSGLGALDDRKQKMDFTESYYRSRTVYVGKPGIDISEEGLRNKKLSAQAGSMQLTYLKSQWGDVATVVAATFQNVTGMLQSGEVDAVLVDGLVGYGFLKSEQGMGFDLLGDPLEIDNVLSLACIGVRKGDTALVNALNDGIVSLRLTGEYDRITRKYFAFSIY